MNGWSAMKYFLVLLGSLQVADGFLTQFLVSGGVVKEGNSLVEPLVIEGNFLFLKLTGAIFSVLVMYFTYRLFPRLALTATSGMVVFYGAVALWNVAVLFNSWLAACV